MINYKHPDIDEPLVKRVAKVLRRGELSGFRGSLDGHYGGKHIQALEEAFCKYFNVEYAISMNSATACLHSALVACGVGLGDEVVVTPYSFSSSVSCVLMVGATPVFADIEEETFCIDIKKLNLSRSKAIIPVHLCGHPAELPNSDIKIIEDTAQAIGATYKGQKLGTIGDCGVFSFNQSKHISTGEGGMLITNDDYIARIARAMRNHGEVADPALEIVGYNYRMCEVEAVLALEQFKELDFMNEWRVGLADYMTERLSEIDGLTPPIVKPDCTHSYYTYAVKYDQNVIGVHRDEFQDRLLEKEVYFGKGYVKPLYLLPVYRKFGYTRGLCPVTERMWKDELMVFDWLRAPVTVRDIDKVIEIVEETIEECR